MKTQNIRRVIAWLLVWLLVLTGVELPGCTMHASAAAVKITYQDKALTIKSSWITKKDGVYMIALKQVLALQGPRIEFMYTGASPYFRASWENMQIAVKDQAKKMYVNGQKIKLKAPAYSKVLSGDNFTSIFVPMEQTCELLGFTVTWDEEEKELALKKKNVKFYSIAVYTSFSKSLAAYAAEQHSAWSRFSDAEYRRVLKTINDNTNNFQYLRLNAYHEVDEKKFLALYQYLIRIYCKENRISYHKSVLYGQGEALLAAAQRYKLDPVFLACQTFQESAYGTSELASGKSISKVAYENFQLKSNGKLKTKALKKKTKVYNLYGIKAIDSDPMVGGTSYAYYQGWTTVKKALEGSAQYIAENYIYSSYGQNTLFELRYNPSASKIWHQYATDAYYAQEIGKKMFLMSDCYDEEVKLVFDFPKYASSN